MRDFANRAVQGHRSAPLTKRQRQTLAMLARRCYAALEKYGAVDGGFEEWRHAESVRCCGLRISEAENRHYLTISAHFYNLMGQSGVALKKIMKAETESRAYAYAKLKRECHEAGLSLDYPRAIARDKYKTTDLEALTDKQLWHLTFSVRRRAQKNRAMKTGGRTAGDAVASALAAAIAKARARNSNPF